MRLTYRVPLLNSVVPQLRTNTTKAQYSIFTGRMKPRTVRNYITDMERASRHMTVLKPGRVLGGPWMDRFVSNHKAVALCNTCCARYGRWWDKYDYDPILYPLTLSDCDGCGQVLMSCTTFVWKGAPANWAQKRGPK